MFIKNENYNTKEYKTKNFVEGYYLLTKDITNNNGTMKAGSIIYAERTSGNRISLIDKDDNEVLIDLCTDADAICKPTEILELEEKKTYYKDASKYEWDEYILLFFEKKKKEKDIIKDENLKYPEIKEIRDNLDKSSLCENITKGFLSSSMILLGGGLILELLGLISTPVLWFSLLPMAFSVVSLVLGLKYSGRFRVLKNKWRKDVENEIFALESKLDTPEYSEQQRENIISYFKGKKSEPITPKKNDDILIPKEAVSFKTETEQFAGGLSLTRTVKNTDKES